MSWREEIMRARGSARHWIDHWRGSIPTSVTFGQLPKKALATLAAFQRDAKYREQTRSAGERYCGHRSLSCERGTALNLALGPTASSSA